MNHEIVSQAILDSLNRNRGENKHTSPSPDIYPDVFLWDGCFISILRARHGDSRGAVQELSTVLEGLDPETGFIPNMRFATKNKWWDPERRTFTRPEFGSDYTQPPLQALAAWEIYLALEASEGTSHATAFLGEVYPTLTKSYEYFMNYRENGNGSSIIANIHPHETGMDKNPGNDGVKKWRLETNGPQTSKTKAILNAGLDYINTLLLNRKLQAVGWDPEKARDIFWLNDPMFNSVYADNLSIMGELADKIGRYEEGVAYRLKAAILGNEIIETMWESNAGLNKKTGLFLARNRDRIIDSPHAMTISNIFPAMLPQIKDDQLRSILTVMGDPNWFGTEYPFPSVPVYSKSYDPDYKEPGGIWRGPVWVNMNWLLVERALLQHAKRKEFINPKLANECLQMGLHVATQSWKMIQNGLGEFHQPHTGVSLRLENFAWANKGLDLGITADKIIKVFDAHGTQDRQLSVPAD